MYMYIYTMIYIYNKIIYIYMYNKCIYIYIIIYNYTCINIYIF